MQVADRFHLLCNLREALMRALDRHHHDLREAARAAAACHPQPVQPVAQTVPVPPVSPPAYAEQAKEVSRSRRLERYNRVMELGNSRDTILNSTVRVYGLRLWPAFLWQQGSAKQLFQPLEKGLVAQRLVGCSRVVCRSLLLANKTKAMAPGPRGGW